MAPHSIPLPPPTRHLAQVAHCSFKPYMNAPPSYLAKAASYDPLAEQSFISHPIHQVGADIFKNSISLSSRETQNRAITQHMTVFTHRSKRLSGSNFRKKSCHQLFHVAEYHSQLWSGPTCGSREIRNILGEYLPCQDMLIHKINAILFAMGIDSPGETLNYSGWQL